VARDSYLNDVGAVQAVHAIDPEHALLNTNQAFLVSPAKARLSDYLLDRLDEDAHVVELQTSAAGQIINSIHTLINLKLKVEFN
jgi:hypothetical protein